MADARAPIAVWRSVRALPEFWRLLELRTVSQFGDGLFQARPRGRAPVQPRARRGAVGRSPAAFAVLYLPYSLLGPFAGALLDRWDRRLVLVGANLGRLLLVLGRRRAAGGRRARPADPVRRADRQRIHPLRLLGPVGGAARRGAARAGGDDELGGDGHRRRGSVPRRRASCCCRAGCSAPTTPGLPQSFSSSPCRSRSRCCCRCASRRTSSGPHESKRAIHGSVAYAVATGWLHGARTVLAVPTVAATLAGLAAHRMVFGINTLLVLVMVRHSDTQSVAGLGTAALFLAAAGIGSFLATVIDPGRGRVGGAATARANGALAVRGGRPARRRRPAAADDGAVRVPARRGRSGGQAVRRHRHADRRRRRTARARVHRPGRAVLDIVHRRHDVRPRLSFPPTAARPGSSSPGRRSISPGWRCTPASAAAPKPGLR